METIPVLDEVGDTVVLVFIRKVESRFDIPETIITIRTEEIPQHIILMGDLECTDLMSSKTNAMAEQLDRMLNRGLNNHQNDCKDGISEMLPIFRAAYPSFTKITPFGFRFGRGPRTALDVWLNGELASELIVRDREHPLENMSVQRTRDVQNRIKKRYDSLNLSHKGKTVCL